MLPEWLDRYCDEMGGSYQDLVYHFQNCESYEEFKRSLPYEHEDTERAYEYIMDNR